MKTILVHKFNYYICSLILLGVIAMGCGSSRNVLQLEVYRAGPFISLPVSYNTIDGMAMSPDSTIILSVPNFNNEYLLQKGAITAPSAAFMAVIGKNDSVNHWYDFNSDDLHPETGKVGPMDCDFGPDGNLYVADRQWFYNKDHKSRIVRINVKDGKAISMDVVVEGMVSCNGMYWKGNVLFVTESVLEKNDSALYSGVYAFKLDEMQQSFPLKVLPFSNGNGDSHLSVTFRSFNHMGSGADGVTFDGQGNLYTTVIEEGTIYKSKLDENNKAVDTKLFVKDKNIIGPDGLIYSPKYKLFFLADFLANAVHAIDLKGNVTTLHKNGDTNGVDGSLDEPAEVILRGDELLIVNMDMAWASKEYGVNTEVDLQTNISRIVLKKRKGFGKPND